MALEPFTASGGVPECDEPMAHVKSSEQLGALLWLAGLRPDLTVKASAEFVQISFLRVANHRLTDL